VRRFFRRPGAKLEPAPEKRLVFTILVAGAKASYDGALEDFLGAGGHLILRAESAEEALAQTRRHQPDLILLDGELGEQGGLRLLGRLFLEQASAAVILMSGHPSVAESVEAMRRGAADYLGRPLDLERLKQAIGIQKLLFKPGANP